MKKLLIELEKINNSELLKKNDNLILLEETKSKLQNLKDNLVSYAGENTKLMTLFKENSRLTIILDEKFQLKNELDKKVSCLKHMTERIKETQAKYFIQMEEEIHSIKNRIQAKENLIKKLHKENTKLTEESTPIQESILTHPSIEYLESNNEVCIGRDVIYGVSRLLDKQYGRHSEIEKELIKIEKEYQEVRLRFGHQERVELPDAKIEGGFDTIRTVGSVTSTERKRIGDLDEIDSPKMPIKVKMKSSMTVVGNKLLPPKLNFKQIEGKYNFVPSIKVIPEKKSNSMQFNSHILNETKQIAPKNKASSQTDKSSEVMMKEYDASVESIKELQEKLEKQKRKNKELTVKQMSIAKNLKLATHKVEIIKDQISLLTAGITDEADASISQYESNELSD